jgi:hypothetical protein
MKTHLLSLVAVSLCTMTASAMNNDELRAALEQRFMGDRSVIGSNGPILASTNENHLLRLAR